MRFLQIIAWLMSLALLAACQPVMPVTASEATTSEASAETTEHEAHEMESAVAANPGVNDGSLSADEKIANAMTGGPAAVSEGATILDWPSKAGGGLTELRAGSNGWTCYPDVPTTPTDDPFCGDGVWLAWVEARVAGEEPQLASIGIAYMLQGGSTASNSDPTLREPAAGEEWMIDGPHIMVLSPEPFDLEVLGAEHRMDKAYVMWAGTPFEHLMIATELPQSE